MTPMPLLLLALAQAEAQAGVLSAEERALTLLERVVNINSGTMNTAGVREVGAADVSFVAGHARMILDGVGLMGSEGHTVNETADLATLPMMAKRMAVLLARLHRDESKQA